MKASIIIPTRNRRKVLERTLKYLFLQDYPQDQYEIIVIDDGSTDGTHKMVKAQESPCRLVCLRHEERKGPAVARNRGIREARGEVVIFIDDDIFCPPQFIREHVKYHEKEGNLIVDGPAINIGEGDFSFADPGKLLLAFFDFFGSVFVTANTSCRREHLLKAGGFDEKFGTGFGWYDLELGFRLMAMGLKRRKNRRAFAFHYKPAQIQKVGFTFQGRLQKQKDRGKNAIYLYKKHPSKKVGRRVRLRYLRYGRLLPVKGRVTEWEETVFLAKSKKKLLWPFLWKIYMIKAYAEGLEEGFAPARAGKEKDG
ncbi:MAG: glycosyltransferase family 2 protein [Firmicutes bacterium]|nr:glycosyltransferase family 2 protein [Bacillota bacterium]